MFDISVVIPTYRRPKDLERCLISLSKQTFPASEILVVVRDSDQETWDFLEKFLVENMPLKILTVSESGVVAAMNLGLDVATGDIVAITDDDAAPHPDWLERLEKHFRADEKIAGVGGKDILQNSNPWDLGTSEIVGKVQGYGRVVAEHHRGVGGAREVDVLKGVNSSYRRSAVAEQKFDLRLLGAGAQIHNELQLCLTLRKQGWKLIYDPAILVDHYVSLRFDNDQRDEFDALAVSNIIHNETLALLEYLSWPQRLVFLLWTTIVGTTEAFGFVQWLRYLPTQRTLSTQKWFASVKGRFQGLATWIQS